MPFKSAADAVNRGDIDAVRSCLEAEPGLATEEGVYDEVMEAADTGCGISMAPISGTLLSLAAKYGRVEIARLLIDSGADVSRREVIHWQGSGMDSRTPLYLAVWAGDADMAHLLLQRGAAPDEVSGASGSAVTALEEAAYRGFTEIARHLLDAGAAIAPRGSEGHLLCRAIQGQHRDIVELLLERGAKADQPTSEGLSPLHVAAMRNCPDIARLLLEKGAYVSDRDDSTLLAVAASATAHWEDYVDGAPPGLERDWRAKMQEEHLQLVRLLLESGALKCAPGSLDHVLTLFHDFDNNGDGVIQREELVAVLGRLGDDWTEDRVNELLVAADLNRDGKIQFEEFITWVFGEGEEATAVRSLVHQSRKT
mmetsp:Transcript_120946/g.342140  ORF Transcript_120946/g.342140 Transcript_120946/m.342140 type:complete len:368 (-) Transcript_120946:113-1216(-)